MEENKNTIVHACTSIDFDKAKEIGEYKSKTLDTTGYIHCSETDTILRVANSNWVGRKDLFCYL